MAFTNLRQDARRTREDSGTNTEEALKQIFALNAREAGQPITGLVLADPADFLILPQVRRRASENQEEEDANLRESIAETRRQSGGIKGTGYLQPVIGRLNPDPVGPSYVLVKGFRRVAAGVDLKRGGHVDKIPAFIETEARSEQQQTAEQIIENVQRVGLNILDLSDALYKMHNEWGWSWGEIGRRIGFQERTLKRYVKIQDMEPDVQELLAARSDALTSAEEINKIPDAEKRAPLLERAAAGEGTRTLLPDVQKVRTQVAMEAVQSNDDNAEPAAPSGPAPQRQRAEVEKRFKKLNSQVAKDRSDLRSIRKEAAQLIMYFGEFTGEQRAAVLREIELMRQTLTGMENDLK